MTGSVDGDRLRAEIETLRVRLSNLTEAILRISEDLDLDTVLQEVAGECPDADRSALQRALHPHRVR